MSINRRMMRTAASCVGIGIVFFSAAAALASPAGATRQAPPVPDLSWGPCDGDSSAAECAVAEVPLDYDQPRGHTTPIALARIAATDRTRKIGTLFVNPGGPGGSGVELVLSGFGATLAELLGGRFDIVGFDPRGVAASAGLRCFETQGERDELLDGQPQFPYQHAQERPFFQAYHSYARNCLARRSAVRAHMSTADVVRDLDLLRQAVGDARLTYLGFSYGSFIGNTYANLFPQRVRALAIDGVLDPRLWSGSLQIISDRVASAEVFGEFLRLCEEAGADNCALSAGGSAAARYEALAASLLETPLVLPDGSTYAYDTLIGDSVGFMYVPELWGGGDGLGALLAALADAVLGVPGAGTRAVAARRSLYEQLERAQPQREDYDGFPDQFFGNHCADAEYPRSLGAFHGVGEFAESGSVFGPWWWWSLSACADWPVAQDRYAGPWATRTSAPVLVVGNFFDPATDYNGAVASSRLLRNSRLLSYAGWGHTAFGRSECVTRHVVRYLLDGTLPAAGTVCPANANPLLPQSALRARKAVLTIGLPPPRPGSR